MWRLGALIVCLLAARSAIAGAPTRVSVEISARPGDDVDAHPVLRLKELLIARLSQEGFTVVLPEAGPDVAVDLAFGEHGGTIRAARPDKTLEREVPRCGISLPEDQLEIVQKATELVRKAVLGPAEPPTQPAPPVSAPGAASEHFAGAMIAEQPRSPPMPFGAAKIEVSTGLDLLIRGGRVDPMARLGGRLALNRSFGVHLTTGLSGASDGGIDVLEIQALVGIGYRLLATGRLSVEAVAAGGLLLHHYGNALDAGDRLDELALLAVTSGVRLSRHAGLALRIAPGLAHTEYVHVASDGAVSWTRSRFRIEAGIGLFFQ